MYVVTILFIFVANNFAGTIVEEDDMEDFWNAPVLEIEVVIAERQAKRNKKSMASEELDNLLERLSLNDLKPLTVRHSRVATTLSWIAAAPFGI